MQFCSLVPAVVTFPLCIISENIIASLSFHSLSNLRTCACCAWISSMAFDCSILAASSAFASTLLRWVLLESEWLIDSSDDFDELVVVVLVWPKTDPYSFLFKLIYSVLSWLLQSSLIVSRRLLIRLQISFVRVTQASILLAIWGVMLPLRRIGSYYCLTASCFVSMSWGNLLRSSWGLYWGFLVWYLPPLLMWVWFEWRVNGIVCFLCWEWHFAFCNGFSLTPDFDRPMPESILISCSYSLPQSDTLSSIHQIDWYSFLFTLPFADCFDVVSSSGTC